MVQSERQGAHQLAASGAAYPLETSTLHALMARTKVANDDSAAPLLQQPCYVRTGVCVAMLALSMAS